MAAIVAAMCLPAGASAAVIRDTRYHISGLCTGGDLTAAFGSGSKINRITVTTSTATGNTGDLTATVRGRTATFTATMPMIGNDGTAQDRKSVV